MFIHSDLKHWLGNMFTLAYTAHALDFGFFPSSLLFLGGGIAGLLWQLFVEVGLKTEVKSLPMSFVKVVQDYLPSDFNWIKDKLSSFTYTIPSKPISLCGASAGCFAFFGSDLLISFYKLRREWKEWGEWKKSGHISRSNYHSVQFTNLLFQVLYRSAFVLTEIFYSSLTKNALSELYIPTDIAYSAHVGGFLFGITATSLFIDPFHIKI